MLEIVENKEEIENLYKSGSNAPYQPVNEPYFGYIGVLLSDKKTGKVQCHICGEWKNQLGFHLFKKHNINSTEYKKIFGFPKHFPLCSVNHSATMANCALKCDHTKGLKASPIENLHTKKNTEKRLKTIKENISSASHENQLNLCKDQILKRVGIVADKIGHFPSSTEIEKIDAQCYWGIIRKHGTWNKFKQAETIEDIRVYNRTSSDTILYLLNEWKQKNNRKPVKRDFYKSQNGYPHYNTVCRHFGSWSRAIQMAGIA